jgi:cytochrome c-type biogenesis protein CcmH/NrfF
MRPSATSVGSKSRVPHPCRAFCDRVGLLKSVTKFRFLSSIFLGVLLLLGAGDDSARIDRLGHQMMCVCGCNQILLECNHVGCAYSSRMRNELVAGVDEGDSDGTILQAFIQKYGTTVLAAPTLTGWVNRAAWVMPYAALGLGIGAVVLIARTWRKRPPGPPTSGGSSAAGTELDRFRAQARKETDL